MATDFSTWLRIADASYRGGVMGAHFARARTTLLHRAGGLIE